MANGLAYEAPQPVHVTIPAEQRRAVAGAIYEAAANLDVKANRAKAGTRQRAEYVAQAAALRELAEDIQP